MFERSSRQTWLPNCWNYVDVKDNHQTNQMAGIDYNTNVSKAMFQVDQGHCVPSLAHPFDFVFKSFDFIYFILLKD